MERIVARLDSDALKSNYHAIQDLVPEQSILPMIKADGYGHGAAWVARELMHLSGLYGFGVATLEEGGALRKELGARARRMKIVVFSGGIPWNETKGRFCEKHGLTPVIATDADWHAFLRGGWAERISYELKFNTGMNRLGMTLNLAPAVARALRNKPAISHPDGVFSHLAIGESPEARLSRSQVEKFIWLKSQLAPAFPSTQFHLANSAGIWNHKLFGMSDITDAVRPGLSLYGIPPWKGAPARGLLPVLTLDAHVVHVHRLKAGDTVGYGATYEVEGTKPTYVAILAAGYADGISRVLSNQGHAWIHHKLTRFVGRVSMDLCAIACPEGTKTGEWAQLLGPHIDPWAQAAAAQTIPYELLTSLSSRVQRVYG